MIDGERVKRWASESLKAQGKNPELSPQAMAVVDAIVRELNVNGAKAIKSLSPTKDLTDGWLVAFRSAHGRDYAGFKVNGAKDGAAAKRLLATGLPPEQIIGVAKEAWSHPDWFNCKQAATLAGFACRFEDIRAELDNPPPEKFTNGRKQYDHNPHNVSGSIL